LLAANPRMALQVKNLAVRDLTPWDGVRASVRRRTGRRPAAHPGSHNRRDRKVFDVVRLNVKTGAQTVVATNPGNINNWITDHKGRVRLGVASDGVNNTVLYRDTQGGEFKPIIRTDFRTAVEPQFFDRDNQRLYATSNRDATRRRWCSSTRRKPDAEALVYEHPQVDVYGAELVACAPACRGGDLPDRKAGREFSTRPCGPCSIASAQLPGMELNAAERHARRDAFCGGGQQRPHHGCALLLRRQDDRCPSWLT
jgi:hypothetical protein